MSFCRFTSEFGKCDVFCYRDNDGYHTHVANKRLAEQYVCKYEPHVTQLRFESEWCRFFKWYENQKLVVIDHALAGKHFLNDCAHGCIALLRDLRLNGFNVPDYVLDDINKSDKYPSSSIGVKR